MELLAAICDRPLKNLSRKHSLDELKEASSPSHVTFENGLNSPDLQTRSNLPARRLFASARAKQAISEADSQSPLATRKLRSYSDSNHDFLHRLHRANSNSRHDLVRKPSLPSNARPYDVAHARSLSVEGHPPSLHRLRSTASTNPPTPSKYMFVPLPILWHNIKIFFSELKYLLVLAGRLVRQLGLFRLWMFMTFRLILFATCLTTAWIKIGRAYYLDRHTLRSIRYGPHNRNFLDIYLPYPTSNKHTPILKIFSEEEHLAMEEQRMLDDQDAREENLSVGCPVLVYITGGAWIIGYKAWGALLAYALRAHGCIVVSVDYRNFPQGIIGDMVEDVEASLRWVWENIEDYGGDIGQIYLAGQSAGAHITSVMLLRNAKREAQGFFTNNTDNTSSPKPPPGNQPPASEPVEYESNTISIPLTSLNKGFPVSRLRGYAGISGLYDVGVGMIKHLDSRGLPAGVVTAIMGGVEQLKRVSPTRLLRRPDYIKPSVIGLIPPIILIHGTADRSVPVELCEAYAQGLSSAGVPVELRLYEEATHTDPIIENLLIGYDRLSYDLIAMMKRGQRQDKKQGLATHPNSISDSDSEFSGDDLKTDEVTTNTCANSCTTRKLHRKVVPLETADKFGEEMIVPWWLVKLSRFFQPF